MKVLLDTHALLWYVLDDPRLSIAAGAAIRDPANDVRISPVTLWEIAIKVSLGKLPLHRPFEDFLDACLNIYRFAMLGIEARHLVRLAALPYPTSHKDPFDRLLVAQALAESMPLVSGDAALDAYGVTRRW